MKSFDIGGKMIQNPTLPVQQAAVQQQFQQGQIPVQGYQTMPEFNAIKININGAQVSPGQNLPVQYPSFPEAPGQKLNYIA